MSPRMSTIDREFSAQDGQRRRIPDRHRDSSVLRDCRHSGCMKYQTSQYDELQSDVCRDGPSLRLPTSAAAAIRQKPTNGSSENEQ